MEGVNAGDLVTVNGFQALASFGVSPLLSDTILMAFPRFQAIEPDGVFAPIERIDLDRS